jgi:sugar-specific transcriptional regulator TrmB
MFKVPQEMLNLNKNEEKIIQVTSKMALSMSMISRATQIPRSSIPYMLKNLEKRGFVRKIHCGKRSRWKSDIVRILRVLKKTSPKIFARKETGPLF